MSEMMRVLIGYDGSNVSDVVFEDLKKAGLPKRLEAVVLTAANMTFPSYLDMATKGQEKLVEQVAAAQKVAMERAESDAKRGAEKLRTLFPLWAVHSEAHGESAVWALVNKAEEWKADLIVVGAHGHSGLGRFMGSVSQLVLMEAPCSVRVARPSLNPAAQESLKILVAVDGSTGAEKALSVVQGRQWPGKTEIRVFSVLQHHVSLQMTHMVPPDLKAVHPATALERQAVNQMAESLAGRLRGEQLEAAAYVREGDPKHILITEAETWKADGLFLGARGLSPLRRFLLGSVSMAVAARAHCSVEVVRSP